MNPDDLEKIAIIRLVVGDVQGSPFYPIFQDSEYLQFLSLSNGNVKKAILWAATSASMMLSGMNSREKTGDITVWNDSANNYLKALRLLMDTQSKFDIPENLMPWSSGYIKDVCSYVNNPAHVVNPLLSISTCDKYRCNDGSGSANIITPFLASCNSSVGRV